tara:strand:+ start:594 stop:1259 length:666 start_codon:yes stop_codon:yes gene_type:complete
MKSLYPNIDWNSIKMVGFDLDGTLYEEFDFIYQVYDNISKLISKYVGENSDFVLDYLLEVWMSKGSSYNKIFDDFLSLYNFEKDQKEKIIIECLSIFRNFVPSLKLSYKVNFLLKNFSRKYELFLVTDGREKLQKNKIKSLGIDKFIKNKNIIISSKYKNIKTKIDLNMIEKLTDLKSYLSCEVVFFGDRKIDLDFSKRNGFNFIPVSLMEYNPKIELKND